MLLDFSEDEFITAPDDEDEKTEDDSKKVAGKSVKAE